MFGKAHSSADYIAKYREMREVTIRSLFRHLVLSGLAAIGAKTGWIQSGLKRSRIHFLSFHHVFEDEEMAFRRLVHTLSEHHTFIGYSEAVDRVLQGAIDQPYITFSFDDGFENCLRGVRVLDEFGARSCVFPIGSMVEVKDYQEIRAFCQHKLHVPPIEFLDWRDLHSIAERGHEVGVHTLTHPNLARLSPAELRYEIHVAAELLRARLGRAKHFAWPYGKFSRFSPLAARLVFQSGFISCASSERGAHTRASGLGFCVRRDHVIASWPVAHTLLLLAKSSWTASPRSGEWPEGWQVIAG